MKHIILGAVFLTVSFPAISQTNYKISAKIANNFTNKVVIVDEKKTLPLTVIDGGIIYSGFRQIPGVVQLGIDFSGKNTYMLFPVFVNGGDVRIKFLNNNSFVVYGSKETEDYHNKIYLPIRQFNTKRDSLATLLSKTIKGSNNTVTLNQELIKNVDSCYQVPQDFIYNNPNSIVSIQALYSLGKGKNRGKVISLSDLDKMFMSLSSAVRTSESGKLYAERLNAWIREEIEN